MSELHKLLHFLTLSFSRIHHFHNLFNQPLTTFELFQARVIHNCSTEWLKIKEAAEKAKEAAVSDGDEVGEVTCSELLEALELSRCLYLMKYYYTSLTL